MFSSDYKPERPLKGFEHINRYWDKRMNTAAAKILPGECYVSRTGEMIVTVLGSCISACIRDRVIGIGGMNHFMLPVASSDSMITRPNAVNKELCYGNWAMEYLINAILKQGGKRERLEVKVFGGGRVLTCMTNIDVGKRNIDFLLNYLERDGLAIAAQDLGHDYPRKVLYFPDTGAVKLKKLRTRANTTIEQREKAYLDSMVSKPAEGDIELF
ncbi:chemoreceptor glutamine deamidase CheD [Teredinibacter turnerae]|uniref:chemoreceptor glutamine deamidase CheD n=1 Tax=Teredinibacter turnerae TaxID=2426 RepID=UPI0030CD7AE0